MAQRALAREARRAVQRWLVAGVLLQPHHPRALVQGRCVQRAGRSEQRHLRHAERRGHVHQPRVVADHRAGPRDQCERFQQAGAAGKVDAMPAARRLRDLLAQGRFLARAEQHRRPVQAARELGEMDRGPALGRPVLGAGREHDIALGLQRVPRQCRADLRRRQLQPRPVLLQPLDVAAQGRIERHHRRFVLRILQPVGEQAHPRFAEVADPLRNAGEKRQQRALDGIGQHVGRVEAAVQLLGQRAAGPPLQAAVPEREFDHLLHLRHGPVHRRHPGQRPHREPLAARLQSAQQRLGHHGVTDPLGGDDQSVQLGSDPDSGQCGRRRAWSPPKSGSGPD